MNQLSGILNFYKPIGITSHTVVLKLRKLLGIRKIGHAGTLDPLAEGVLVICIGSATKMASYITNMEKEYETELTFGISTTTGDREGEIKDKKEKVKITLSEIKEKINQFVGEIEQVPPMASAVHYQGERLYKLYRQGKKVTPPPRKVKIYSLDIISFIPEEFPRLKFKVICSKGTYIRTLCEDIGQVFNLPAYMSGLVRTRVGKFKLKDALTEREVTELFKKGQLSKFILKTVEKNNLRIKWR